MSSFPVMSSFFVYAATQEKLCPRGGASAYITLAHGVLSDCWSRARAESFIRDQWADIPAQFLDVHLTEYTTFAGAAKAFAERCGLPEYHKVKRLHLRY